MWIVLGVVGGVLILGIIGTSILLSLASRMTSTVPTYSSDYYDDYGYEMAKSNSLGLGSSDLLEEVAELAPAPEAKYDAYTGTQAGETTAAGEVTEELTEQKVIKTGSLSIQVKNVEDTVSDLNNLTETKKGFVQSSNITTTTSGSQSATVTIKVPSQEFNNSVESIKDMADLVKNENLSGQDVTEEFTDLQSRLKNYQAEEAQLVEFLDRAGNVEELLDVSGALSDVREDIEVVEGRIKYLENMTDMSTITVNISQETTVNIPTKEWQPWEKVKKSFKVLIEGLQGLVNLLIVFVIVILPFILVFALIIWFIIWVIRKLVQRNKRKKEKRIVN